MPFSPTFTITPAIAAALMRVEAAKQALIDLPITLGVMSSLRETARLRATHYSTMIEGNRLTQQEVIQVVARERHFAGRARDEQEVLGYYAALEQVEQWAKEGDKVSVRQIQALHALVMGAGRRRVKATAFRDGQNVIRDQGSGRIVYLPPEATDVPLLMRDLVDWMNETACAELPSPLRAGLTHYQFATIHPYYDGNGRTARLLTTLVLHMSGYDLKGIYSLEEYYARDLGGYYQALNIGPSHNYYGGRATAEVTPWLAYFCIGMAESFATVIRHAESAARDGEQDSSRRLRELDARQRKAITLFHAHQFIAARDIAQLFAINPRTARHLCQQWVESGFLVVADPAKKSRRYALAKRWQF